MTRLCSPNDKQCRVRHRSCCVKRYFEVRSYAEIPAEFLHAFETTKAPFNRQIQLLKVTLREVVHYRETQY